MASGEFFRGGAYMAHFGRRGDYATLKIAHMARSGRVCATHTQRTTDKDKE